MSQNPMYDKMTERADGIFTSSSFSSTHPGQKYRTLMMFFCLPNPK